MKRGRKKGDNAARDAELIRFYLEGHALRQTGARYSITYERVRQILNKTGIKPRKSSPSVKQFKPRKTQTSQERFWSLVDRSGSPDACWEWQGPRTTYGYGRVRIFNKQTYAHRVALYLGTGRRVQNHALHHCDNPPCCNPKHLYDGTPQDNMRDLHTRGREKWEQAHREGQRRRQEKRLKESLQDA